MSASRSSWSSRSSPIASRYASSLCWASLSAPVCIAVLLVIVGRVRRLELRFNARRRREPEKLVDVLESLLDRQLVLDVPAQAAFVVKGFALVTHDILFVDVGRPGALSHARPFLSYRDPRAFSRSRRFRTRARRRSVRVEGRSRLRSIRLSWPGSTPASRATARRPRPWVSRAVRSRSPLNLGSAVFAPTKLLLDVLSSLGWAESAVVLAPVPGPAERPLGLRPCAPWCLSYHRLQASVK